MKTRFIKAVIEAARDCDSVMPWSRRARRRGPGLRRRPPRGGR